MNSDYIRRLPFEKRLQLSIDAYALIYPTRMAVMDHLFATIGNGYEWSSGILVSHDEAEIYTARLPKDYELVLPPDGKAQRTDKSMDYFLDLEERDGAFDKELQKNINYMKDLNLDALEKVMPEEVAEIRARHPLTIAGVREDYKAYMTKDSHNFYPYPLCQYACMFEIEPVEMRLDWAHGLLEYITLREADRALRPSEYEDDEHFYYKKMKEVQVKLIKLLGKESTDV